MRSASEGAFQLARGSRIPFGDDSTLRFFIYWIGRDIDLSVTLYDETLRPAGRVSYANLRHYGLGYHSGDITRAPDGAAEFIDIDIKGALAKGVRYTAMNVLVFNGPSFKEHEACYAGWMTRSKPNSNEIFEPATVQQKVDLTSETRHVVPALFDLKERKMIWVDMASLKERAINNVESNRATIKETIEAIIGTKTKVNLYELFSWHAEARGEIVDSREEADTVFSIDEGITPYQVFKINSEFVI